MLRYNGCKAWLNSVERSCINGEERKIFRSTTFFFGDKVNTRTCAKAF